MIQVCSRCGTRWNVRDRQRVWCPRCQGSLLAPSPTEAPQWSTSAAGPKQRLPAGYRWIAVRPGAAPPQRRPNRPLGPTPRYAFIPRWGLQDHVDLTAAPETVEPPRTTTRMVRGTLVTTLFVLAVAAVVHVGQYALLLFNRTTLLNPIVAGMATWGAVTVGVIAFFMLVATLIVMTNWLIGRRAAAYAIHGAADPRPGWQLWLGCLMPFVNLVLAPLFVIELARFEGRLSRLRTIVAVWWCAWVVSYLVSVYAIVTGIITSITPDVQRIADNTVVVTIAYLVALVVLLLTVKVFRGFEARTVERPVTRWVMMPGESPDEPEATSRVSPERDEPAA